MKRWIAFVAGFYPRSWRDEFGEEFGALLDDIKPSWRVFRNVLGGAIRMQITERTGWMKVVGATAVAGALVAGGLSFTVAPHYVSSAEISVTPQADPARPVPPEALHDRAIAHAIEMEGVILSRADLSTIINDPRLQLYEEERRRRPLEDVIDEMRNNIHIQARPSADGGMAPVVFSISFSYPDQAKAQATIRALADKFTQENVNMNRMVTESYQGFWGDWATQFTHSKPAPAPPVGEIVGVLNSANLPTESVGPNRVVFLVWGLGAGLFLGLLGAFAMRRPRGVWRLGGFALAGFAAARAVSFLIPSRFTSSSVMEIAPAILTEDPLTPLPAATPATEFLRQMEPEVLSYMSLATIIQDRRLNLYSSERAKKPMEEVVRNMLDDIRIVPLEPAFGAKGTVSAFSISFSYSDRYKAQQTVNALMNAFFEFRQSQTKSNLWRMSMPLRQITERKAGEVLEVLDPASLPMSPGPPNRLAISLAGLGIGLLIGVIRLWRWRPVATLQPA